MVRIGSIVVSTLILLAGCRPPETPMDEPYSSEQWVIRTDFSDDAAWAKVRDLIAAPQQDIAGSFRAYVKFVSDETNRGKKPHELVAALPDNYPGFFCFIVDRECLANPEHPVLVIGFCPSDQNFDRRPRSTPSADIATFRALPSRIQAIQNNLDIANMDFEDFAGDVDSDGVFRNFR